jgi:hypothetical protein
VDKVCLDIDVNLALFEDAADVGWVTTNRFRQEGSALGFLPVITLPQVRHVENTGGYSRLLVMSIPEEAQELVTEGIVFHTNLVGAEPYFTQATAGKGYLITTYDSEYTAYVGGHNARGRTSQAEEGASSCQLTSKVLPRRRRGGTLGIADRLIGPGGLSKPRIEKNPVCWEYLMPSQQVRTERVFP